MTVHCHSQRITFFCYASLREREQHVLQLVGVEGLGTGGERLKRDLSGWQMEACACPQSRIKMGEGNTSLTREDHEKVCGETL